MSNILNSLMDWTDSEGEQNSVHDTPDTHIHDVDTLVLDDEPSDLIPPGALPDVEPPHFVDALLDLWDAPPDPDAPILVQWNVAWNDYHIRRAECFAAEAGSPDYDTDSETLESSESAKSAKLGNGCKRACAETPIEDLQCEDINSDDVLDQIELADLSPILFEFQADVRAIFEYLQLFACGAFNNSVFYVGITESPTWRWNGGVNNRTGERMKGHKDRGCFEYMRVLFCCEGFQAGTIEKHLIANIKAYRANNVRECTASFLNEASGGQGIARCTQHVLRFIYVCH